MPRILQIAYFNLRVMLVKLIFILVFLPLGILCISYWIICKRARWMDIVSMFDPREWQDVFGDTIEALVGCRWHIVGSKRPDNLPTYCYYHRDDKFISCLFLEDATLLNFKYGGQMTRKPYRTMAKNNAENGFMG